MEREQELKEAAIAHYGDDVHLYAKQRDGFKAGAQWEADRVNKELTEKSFALGNAYRLLKLIDNTVGLTEPQRKRVEQINQTIIKYFNASECLRITQSELPPAPKTQ